jgi:drug/metabolite transporter (DMT)-like permease
MIGALLATVLFSLSAITATRTAKVMGGTEANFWRLTIAMILLAVYAHVFGYGISGVAFQTFLISGCVGFGIGDVALFQALPRIGTRLSILMVNCLAAPIAAMIEWLWLGTTLSGVEMVCAAVILGGVALALAPGENPNVAPVPPRQFTLGIIAGSIAALGQGGGAVLSRRGFEIARLAAQNIDALTATYQRIIGGVIIAGACLLVVKRRFVLDEFRAGCTKLGILFQTRSSRGTGQQKGASSPLPSPPSDGTEGELPKLDAALEFRVDAKSIHESKDWRLKWRRGWIWILLNALAGPTFGVSCYLWGLKTTKTAIVLSIVAITPLVAIPLTAWLEGERPRKRSIIGGIVAVAGVVALVLMRTPGSK